MKADFMLANPAFNVSERDGDLLREDRRWFYGVPPVSNANFAWLSHMTSKLSPKGMVGVVLANGSLSTQQPGEGEVRQKMVERDLVECVVALPGQLFYTMPIPVSFCLLNRGKSLGCRLGWRERRGEVLFIDARKMGYVTDRTHREFTDEDVARIADIYHAWHGEPEAIHYEDVSGFCASAIVEQIAEHRFVLTHGRYVETKEAEDNGEPMEEKFTRLKGDPFAASYQVDTKGRELPELAGDGVVAKRHP